MGFEDPGDDTPPPGRYVLSDLLEAEQAEINSLTKGKTDVG